MGMLWHTCLWRQLLLLPGQKWTPLSTCPRPLDQEQQGGTLSMGRLGKPGGPPHTPIDTAHPKGPISGRAPPLLERPRQPFPTDPYVIMVGIRGLSYTCMCSK
ncbi:TPA: hypothetical protein ACH3X1_002575 [Trebouxia sp. C0004]